MTSAPIDLLVVTPDTDMWVDDEGLLKARPRINQLASYIATRFGYPFQLYAGTVVFTGGADQAGYTLPLSKAAARPSSSWPAAGASPRLWS